MQKLMWLLRVWAVMVIVLTAHVQAHPAPTLSTRADLQLVKVDSGLRQLLWLWGEDEEVTEQPATHTAESSTLPVTTTAVFTATRKPSRWRWWPSSGDEKGEDEEVTEQPATHTAESSTLPVTTTAVFTTTRKPSRWRWWPSSGDEKEYDEEVTEQPNTMTTRIPTVRTTSVSSTSTKKPSRWRSWFSGAARKVKDELLEAREAYHTSMASVGKAIVAGGNATKEGILGAGRAIKKGAKRFGAAVKAGIRKVRLKFAGSGEKFRIVANRLKEKLEAGDGRALALMEKLGINVAFFGSRITGSSVENNSLPVSEILKKEGLFSNKSASYNTVVESPNIELPGNTAEEHLSGLEDKAVEDKNITEGVINSSEDLHPDPDIKDSGEDEKSATTIYESSLAVTSTPALEGTSKIPFDTKQPAIAITTVVPTTKTKLPSTITQPATTTTRSTNSTPLSTTTRLQTTTPPSTTKTHAPTTTIQSQTTTTKPVVTTTHPPTTTNRPTRTATTIQSITTSTSSPATTALAATISRGTGPPDADSAPDQPMVSQPEEPYEPPPFPDVFSDIEVHDRLKAFYDNGDFSHAELAEMFNFDPDNYEYYYDY